MGQYHILINRDATEHVFPHSLGNGLKAWEQTAGGIPAALVFLLAARPGNAPGDVGQHPLAGRWAGQHILAAGDYAEDSDIPGFGRNPPLSLAALEARAKTDGATLKQVICRALLDAGVEVAPADLEDGMPRRRVAA
jgi:hypothetical protein